MVYLWDNRIELSPKLGKLNNHGGLGIPQNRCENWELALEEDGENARPGLNGGI